MEAKGGFLLKAAGPAKPLQPADNTGDGQKGLSVKEKAKLIENRLQTDFTDIQSITDPHCKPKPIGKVSMQSRTHWPPENPLQEGSKEEADIVDLQECGPSVKTVQGRFENTDNSGYLTNVNKQTNVSGRATQLTATPAPPSVRVLSQNVMSSAIKIDAVVNTETTKKSTSLSVKDLIKRLEYERDSEDVPKRCENTGANTLIVPEAAKVSGLVTQEEDTSERPTSDSPEINRMMKKTDVEVQDLESPVLEKAEKIDEEGSIFVNVLSDTMTSSRPLNIPSNSSSSSSSEGAYDPSREEMNEGLEISWKNETVLENSLRQAVTDMLHPPKITSLYEEEDPILMEEAPMLEKSIGSVSMVDARQEAWCHNEKSGVDSPGLPGQSPEEKIFIPIDATIDTDPTIDQTQSGGNAPAHADDHWPQGEEMGLTSELLLSNDVVTEDKKVTKVTEHESGEEVTENGLDEEKLKKILDDLDAVLLSELEAFEDESMSQTDHLYKKLTDLSKDRDIILLRQTLPRPEEQVLLSANKPDSSRLFYKEEVEELNKETVTRLTTLTTASEETIRAVIIDHQMQQRDLFSKFTAHFTPEITGVPIQPVTKDTIEKDTAMHPTSGISVDSSGLKPEVRSVDVLSQMAGEEEEVSSAPRSSDVIWIPTPRDDEDVTENLRSPLSTSTTTFRMESAQFHMETDERHSEDSGDDSDAKTLGETVIERAGVTVGDVRISLPLDSDQISLSKLEPNETAMVDEHSGHEKMSLNEPGDNALETGAGDFKDSSDNNNYTKDSEDNMHTPHSDEEEAEPMCGTFIMNSDAKTQTFSKVEVQSGPGSSCSDSGSCSDGESLLSDGDDDDDLRRLQQRYGEILQWSDPEKLSESSEDDGSFGDSDEVGEEQQVLEQSLKMTLTSNIKDKLPTMTEQDFSVMMSEYRDVIKQAERKTCVKTTDQDRFETYMHEQDDSERDEEDEADEEYLETVREFTSKQEASCAEAQINDSGLGDTLCPEVPSQGHDTGMDGTIPHTLESNKMCDASTSMGGMTLRANLGIDITPMTSESATYTDNVTSETKDASSQLNATYEAKAPLMHSLGIQSVDSEPGTDMERAAEGTNYNAELLMDLTQRMGATFRTITEDLEAADMEMVQQCSLAQTDGNLQKWELIISEHLERMEDVRRHRQAEAYRNNQRLKHKLLRKKKDDKEAESSSDDGSGDESPAESHPDPTVHMKMIGIQVEEDMLRLKEDLLTKVGSMKEENCTQDEILKVLAEYREGQRELVERRLAEKERASRKLQERLARKKILKEAEERRASPSVTDQIREMDDTFYNTLCERRGTRAFSEDELGTLIAQHVEKVDTFRRRLEEQVRHKRREAIQKRLAEQEGSQEEKARDANFANELVMKQRENADMVKNVRERERARFDEKLQAKLAERKKRRDQKDVDV